MSGARTADDIITDERLDSLERRMDDVELWQKDAVPNGDHIGHRRYHMLMIEDIEGRKRMRQAILEKTIPGLIWGAIVGLGGIFWFAVISFLTKIKGGA